MLASDLRIGMLVELTTPTAETRQKGIALGDDGIVQSRLDGQGLVKVAFAVPGKGHGVEIKIDPDLISRP